MNAPHDEDYLIWLYSQVASVRLKNPERTYWSLLRRLYSTEFVWFVPNDDNRVEDGRNLRIEFFEQNRVREVDGSWFDLECSVLEMLIALARVLSFEADGEIRVWFWHLIDTIDLYQYSDANYNSRAERKIDKVLDTVISRKYLPNGHGGLFPLSNPKEDQRGVEIWYQLSAYLIELM